MKPDNFIGKVISKYKIKKVIGEGSFSTVCLAKEINDEIDDSKDNSIREKSNKKSTLNRYVACKIIPQIKVAKKKLTTRLDQEIRIHQMMHHQNVVQLIDVQKDLDFYYIFLEYCACGELFQIIYDQKKLLEDQAAVFFKQILIGLQYIHSLNVAHRDLKPENILIDQYQQIKISDFGLSKLFDIKSNGLTKTPCGSLCYASPECISGQSYDGKKSDIWSCGVILYTMTTGFLPWTKTSQSELFDQIQNGDYSIPSFLSYSCANLIRRLMTVNVKNRITIEEALNHPFLKEVVVPDSNFNRKFVSLRKIDRFLNCDEDFEYDQTIDHLLIEKCESGFNFDTDLCRIRKVIKSDDEKKREKEENKEVSLMARHGKHKVHKYAIDINQVSKVNDEKRKNKSITINFKLPYSVSPKKINNSRFKFVNQFGIASLAPRRSERLTPI
ncbi:hypothetical protein M9Y10_020786 [Tritrichomonas musculus]|uniref:Protein kinase domain-containing protein n=1 Tax=Tritrichomonas musculus TaxID=1915356 RepID=A0ABR2HEM9_9EUKA